MKSHTQSHLRTCAACLFLATAGSLSAQTQEPRPAGETADSDGDGIDDWT